MKLLSFKAISFQHGRKYDNDNVLIRTLQDTTGLGKDMPFHFNLLYIWSYRMNVMLRINSFFRTPLPVTDMIITFLRVWLWHISFLCCTCQTTRLLFDYSLWGNVQSLSCHKTVYCHLTVTSKFVNKCVGKPCAKLHLYDGFVW